MQGVATTQTVSDTGQITLDQRYAGQKVVVQPVCDGIWHICRADVSPSIQEWFNDPEARQRFDDALAWANENAATAEKIDSILTNPTNYDSFV